MIVVVPMAGRGSRYANRGYETPKPLIEVAGKPMLEHALRSLEDVDFTTIVFVALREHEEQFGFSSWLKERFGDAMKLVLLDDVTEGQLCTVLEASPYIPDSEDVLVISSDTYIKSAIGSHIKEKEGEVKGIISVIDLPGDRWSFARTDADGRVVEVAEKNRISNHASTGIYYFSSGRELKEMGQEMINGDERTLNEFYVIPLYQKMIARGMEIRISEADEMWDMGTPEAKLEFEKKLGYV
ncbi:MAG: glycosyltransferase family 2 protein [Owenweeksia sp.]